MTRGADCNVETRQRQINLEIAPRLSAAPRVRRTDWLVLGRLGDLAADLAASIADDIAPGVDHGAVRQIAGTAVIGGLTGRAGDRVDREGASRGEAERRMDLAFISRSESG